MSLIEKINKKVSLVGVVGLGYVGVPLAVEFGNAGFKVLGFDMNEDKVARFKKGEDVILDVEPGSVKRLMDKKLFEATSDMNRLDEPDVLIVAVPTPVDDHKQPDLGPVLAATKSIARKLRRGQLVMLESTTFPGTTDEVMRPILEAGGLKVGKDFYLGFSPERVDPGNEIFKTKNTPKVVSATTPEGLKCVEALYGAVIDKIVPVSDTRVAEMTKLLENIFRNVNIALVNEMMLLADRMGIDIWEVVSAAGTKPFGFMPFYPGPGVGGHCIPIDPHYLSWKAREYDFTTSFINLAADVNENVPYYVVNKTLKAINRIVKKPICDTRILILGVAFKANVDDARSTTATKLMELFRHLEAKICYHDPYIPELREGREVYQSVALDSPEAKSADVLVIHTDHKCVELKPLLDKYTLVVDTRNATAKFGRRENVVKI